MALMARYLRRLTQLLFIVLLPVFLVLSNVRWMALDPAIYQQGFAKHQAVRDTGLDSRELELAARQLISYFADGTPISLQVSKGGVPAPLFNERETSHLADVRGLFQLVFRVQEIAGLYILAYALGSFVAGRRTWLRSQGKLLLASGALTVGLFLGVYALASLSFADLFLRFHLLSFRNDLWILDPRTDYLIRMFPQAFWLDALLEAIVRSLIAAVALALVGLIVLGITRNPIGAPQRMVTHEEHSGAQSIQAGD